MTVTSDVDRLDEHLSSVANLVRTYDVDVQIESMEKKYSMIQQLLETGRHDKVRESGRISVGKVEAQVWGAHRQLEQEVPPDSLAETYVSISEALLDDIHGFLSELGEQNDDRTGYATDLKNVKQRLSDAKEMLDSGQEEQAAQTAHIALEGCLMLHTSIASAFATQHVTEVLAETVADLSVDLSCDIDACVARGDVQTLLEDIANSLVAETEQSTAERLHRLLSEHDGSVIRTAGVTDFDVETVLEYLSEMYQNGDVADIQVEFEQ